MTVDHRSRVASRTPGARPAGGPRAGRALPLALAVAVVLPLLGLAATVLTQRGSIALGGDQAVIELGARDASSLHATLGPYSRYGWSHPGPFWYYLLAGPYRLMGGSSTAVHLAVLVVHAGFAVLLVSLTARCVSRAAAIAAAAGVLCLYLVLGAEVFRSVWNPYALLVPLVVMVVLAAVAATGSLPALAGAALVASFLAQTHVGAAVPAGLLGVVAVLVGLPTWWFGRRRRVAPREALLAGGLLLATVLAWVPPLVQELRPGTGNLTLLVRFLRTPAPGHSVTEALAGVGSQLLVLPTFGHATPLPLAAARLDPPELAAVLLFALACVLVAVAATARRQPVAAALAAMTLVAEAASVLAVAKADAIIYPYLVEWQVVLPVALLVAAAALVRPSTSRHRRLRASSAQVARRRAAAASLAVLMVGVVAAVVVVQRAAPLSAESRFAVGAAERELTPVLAAPRAGPVRVRIASSASWPLAAGLVLALSQDGYDVRVTPDWTFMFGQQRLTTNREPRELLVAQREDLASLRSLPGARVLAPVTSPALGTSELVVRTAPGGGAVPEAPGLPTGTLLGP